MEITPEIQAAIDAAVAEATKKLNDKNAELRDENRKFKNAAEQAKAEADEAARIALENSGDIEGIKKSLADAHTKELTKANDALKVLREENERFKIDSVIDATIASAGVKPGHVPLLRKALKADAKMKDGVAYLGDDTIEDGLAAYFRTDEAKQYIAPPANTGAGATGSSSAATTHGYTKESLTLTAFSRLAKDNPANANAIAASVGSDLRA